MRAYIGPLLVQLATFHHKSLDFLGFAFLLYIMRRININRYIYMFSVFSLYHVANYPKKLEKISPKFLATLRGVAGTHPFFGKN